jgi:hypothetical protein
MLAMLLLKAAAAAAACFVLHVLLTCSGTGLGRGANDNTCSGVTAGLQEHNRGNKQVCHRYFLTFLQGATACLLLVASMKAWLQRLADPVCQQGNSRKAERWVDSTAQRASMAA